MPRVKNVGEVVNRTLPIAVKSIGEVGENRYEISFSSEEPYTRFGVDEILSHDEESVDLTRLLEVGTFLYTHGKDPQIGRMPIGIIEKAWLDTETHCCRAVVAFDLEDENAVKLKSKLDKGIIKGVSVGYSVQAWECLNKGETSQNGRFQNLCDVATKWTPHEISLEPTPADPTVGFGKSIGLAETNNNQNKEKSMPEKTTVATIDPVVGEKSATENLATTERSRCSEINSLCRGFEIDPTKFIESGDSVDSVRSAILTQLQSQRGAVTVNNLSSVAVTADEGDKFRCAAVDGLLMRGGIKVDTPALGATDFRGISLRDIAVDSLSRSGISNPHRMGNEELFKRSLTPDSQFLAIANGVTQRAMATAYTAAPTTYQLWTGVGSSKDFKPTKIMQISEAGNLSEIKQNGEFTVDEMQDAQLATRQLLTFGKAFGFTRQAFINDDLEMLTKIPAAYARAAQRGINKAVYDLLKSNPTMLDGAQLFSANHKNLGVAGKPSTATYGEALRSMRKQTNLRGLERLNIAPKFVLSPAELEVENRRLLASVSDPSASNSGVSNIFQNSMQLIVDAELDLEGATQNNFFVSSPYDCDTIEVSFLNGINMPTLESKVSFDYLGIQHRIFIDYGITLVDYRGLFKSPTA